MAVIVLLLVLGTAIWAAIDSSKLGVRSGCLGGGFADIGPAGWFFGVLLLWIIGFPLYLVTRPKYLARRTWVEDGRPMKGAPSPSNATTGPPSGWYPDPDDAQTQRWWDGTTWGPQAPEQ